MARNNDSQVVFTIGSNQSLTGYAGGLWRKKWLLEHEAKFHSGVQLLPL
jgi:methylated-DNA-[protein]-cysteine S-methyltransferase